MTHAGQKIKMLRDSKSWSREQLAEKVGISVETIARTEQGKHKLTLDETEKYAEIFDVDPSFFFKKSAGIIFKNISNSPATGIGNTVNIDQNLLHSLVKTMDKMTDFLHGQQANR